MVLGIMLVVEPTSQGPAIYFAASLWALVGGAVLIGDAMRLRRLRQAQAAEATGENGKYKD